MYWLYYTSGSCNEGDHETILEKYPTLGETQARLHELLAWSGYGAVWSIIEGVERFRST